MSIKKTIFILFIVISGMIHCKCNSRHTESVPEQYHIGIHKVSVSCQNIFNTSIVPGVLIWFKVFE